jgi:hypothetical protein
MGLTSRKDMRAYEFYLHAEGEDHLIGILPERRKNQKRITKESIMNWGKMILGGDTDVDFNSLYFVKVEVNEEGNSGY